MNAMCAHNPCTFSGCLLVIIMTHIHVASALLLLGSDNYYDFHMAKEGAYGALQYTFQSLPNAHAHSVLSVIYCQRKDHKIRRSRHLRDS